MLNPGAVCYGAAPLATILDSKHGHILEEERCHAHTSPGTQGAAPPPTLLDSKHSHPRGGVLCHIKPCHQALGHLSVLIDRNYLVCSLPYVSIVLWLLRPSAIGIYSPLPTLLDRNFRRAVCGRREAVFVMPGTQAVYCNIAIGTQSYAL